MADRLRQGLPRQRMGAQGAWLQGGHIGFTTSGGNAAAVCMVVLQQDVLLCGVRAAAWLCAVALGCVHNVFLWHMGEKRGRFENRKAAED